MFHCKNTLGFEGVFTWDFLRSHLDDMIWITFTIQELEIHVAMQKNGFEEVFLEEK